MKNVENQIIDIIKNVTKLSKKVNITSLSELNFVQFANDALATKNTKVKKGVAYFNFDDTMHVRTEIEATFNVYNPPLHSLRTISEIVAFIEESTMPDTNMSNTKLMIPKNELLIETKDRQSLNVSRFVIATTEGDNMPFDFPMTHKRWKQFDKWYSKNRKKLLKKVKTKTVKEAVKTVLENSTLN